MSVCGLIRFTYLLLRYLALELCICRDYGQLDRDGCMGAYNTWISSSEMVNLDVYIRLDHPDRYIPVSTFLPIQCGFKLGPHNNT